MFFYIAKIALSFTDPVAIVFLILVTSTLLRLLGRKHWAWCGFGAAIGFMTIVMFTPLDYWILSPLEERFPLPEPPACLDGIVILGGGEDLLGSVKHGNLLLEQNPMRYVVLSELMHRYPTAKVIFAGGSGLLGTQSLAEADVAKGIVEKLQLESNRMLFDSTSRTTWENAANAKKLAQPKMEERWALLARVSQMPRAVGSFRKIGWDVLPWPTDYASNGPVWWTQSPSSRFSKINEGEHEWLGLITYWMTGQSSELFPGPSIDAPRKGTC